MTAFRHDAWNHLIGAFVEVRKNNEFFRTGIVDDAMPDSSALWLAADGSRERILVEAAEGFQVWVGPGQLEGELRYRMTAPALQAGAKAFPD